MSQPLPKSAITATDEATYNYLTKLSSYLYTPNEHEVLIGRSQPRSTIEPFRCAIISIDSTNKLVFETPPQEGSTRQEAMMKTIEVVETQAQTIMASLEGRSAGWVLAREVAAKKRRERVEEIRRMREEARVRREEARVKREEDKVKREEAKVKEEEADGVEDDMPSEQAMVEFHSAEGDSSELHDGIVAISEQEQGSRVDDGISEAKTEETGENADDDDCEL